MGIFNRIFGSDNDENDTLDDSAKDHTSTPEESDVLLDPELLEGKTDLERRAEIIDTHYEDVSSDEARLIAEVLKEYTETYELQKHEAITKIQEKTGVDRERAKEILWTERFSIQKCDEVRKNLDMTLDMQFEWVVGDEPCSPLCVEVEETTQENPIPLSELQTLLRKTARKYASQGGTPERMDHWVPHHKCKASFRTHMG